MELGHSELKVQEFTSNVFLGGVAAHRIMLNLPLSTIY